MFGMEFLLMVASISSTSSKIPSNTCNIDCVYSPCYYYSLQETIEQLWNVPPQPLSANLQKYRDAIVCSMKDANIRQMAVFFVQTVRSLHRLMNFDPTRSASCVYNDIVSSSNVVKVGKCGNYIQSIRNYRQLGNLGLEITERISAIAAGCDTLKSVPKSNCLPCPLDTQALQTGLCRYSALIPNRIAEVIKILLKSSDLDEQVIGQAGIVAATPPSVDYFSTILETPSYLRMIQLEACTYKIPSSCCCIRKEIIDDNMETVVDNRTIIYDNVIAEHIKMYKCCE